MEWGHNLVTQLRLHIEVLPMRRSGYQWGYTIMIVCTLLWFYSMAGRRSKYWSPSMQAGYNSPITAFRTQQHCSGVPRNPPSPGHIPGWLTWEIPAAPDKEGRELCSGTPCPHNLPIRNTMAFLHPLTLTATWIEGINARSYLRCTCRGSCASRHFLLVTGNASIGREVDYACDSDWLIHLKT